VRAISNLTWGIAGTEMTFFPHIFFVTVVLGLSVVIPIFEIIGYLKRDDSLVKFARRLTSYLVRVDLFAGVLATWLTVFLAAYWPSLMYIATNVLFYPISLAVAGIMIAIVSTAIYWYTWDEMKRLTHIIVGLFMAAGALMVPFGMNSILALMDYPFGVKVTTSIGLTFFLSNGSNPLANPIFLPMALYTWFISITLTSFIVLTFAHIRSRNDFTDEFQKTLRISRIIALIFSSLSLVTILWTFFEFRDYSQYLYLQMTSRGYLTVSIVLAILVVIISILSYNESIGHYAAPGGATVSYALFMFFEVTANVSRSPYMIVTNSTGILASTVINPMYTIPSIIPLGGVAVIALMLITFLMTLYLAFFVFPVADRKRSSF
jgi:cytochrome d ubiquinol oxidase subunit I